MEKAELREAQKQIDSAPWRKTDYILPHEYIIRKEHPVQFRYLAQLIVEHGYWASFYSRKYQYLDIGRYKYWRIGDVLNREILGEHSD